MLAPWSRCGGQIDIDQGDLPSPDLGDPGSRRRGLLVADVGVLLYTSGRLEEEDLVPGFASPGLLLEASTREKRALARPAERGRYVTNFVEAWSIRHQIRGSSHGLSATRGRVKSGLRSSPAGSSGVMICSPCADAVYLLGACEPAWK